MKLRVTAAICFVFTFVQLVGIHHFCNNFSRCLQAVFHTPLTFFAHGNYDFVESLHLQDADTRKDSAVSDDSSSTGSSLRGTGAKEEFGGPRDRAKLSAKLTGKKPAKPTAIKDVLSKETPVNCCGGYFKGDGPQGNSSDFDEISLVISHCLGNLTWVKNFTAGYRLGNITIISKCGKPVEGAPKGSKVYRVPNVGRCDHSYAHWIRTMKEDQHDLSDKHVVVFLKDTHDVSHIPGFGRSFSEMLSTAAGPSGYGCGSQLSQHLGYHASAFHNVSILSNFNLPQYYNRKRHVKYSKPLDDSIQFRSKYSTLAEFVRSIRAKLPKDIMPVCYGGEFSVKASNLLNQQNFVWRALETTLSRGDNIEESHFVERLWAVLLSNPVPTNVKRELLDFSDGTVKDSLGIRGAIGRKVAPTTLVVYSGPVSLNSTIDAHSSLYQSNFEYFLKYGIGCSAPEPQYATNFLHDTILVLTEETAAHYESAIEDLRQGCREKGVIRPNLIRVMTRENRCYDMESFRVVLESADDIDLEEYKYMVFVNCGVAGPRLPSDWDVGRPWTDRLTRLLNGDVLMSGVAANTRHPRMIGSNIASDVKDGLVGVSSHIGESDAEPMHVVRSEGFVHSIAFALHRKGLGIVRSRKCVFDCGDLLSQEDGFLRLHRRYEIGMSHAILKAGYAIAAIIGDVRIQRNHTLKVDLLVKKTRLLEKNFMQEDLWPVDRRWSKWEDTLFFKTSRFVPVEVQKIMKYDKEALESTADNTEKETESPEQKEQGRRVVFYNIFVKDKKMEKRTLEIVKEQMKQLKTSKLLKSASVNYTVLGYNSTDKIQRICGSKCHLTRYERKGDEFLTLQPLYEHCVKHPEDQVTYIHDKGSFHDFEFQENWRVMLTKSALSDECQSMPKDKCNVCSSRFSPLPHFHTSGNMWSAHCSYVKELIAPRLYTSRMEEMFQHIFSKKNVDIPIPFNTTDLPGVNCEEARSARLGRHRFAMEHWIHAHPSSKPCDVYPGDYQWLLEKLPPKDVDWKPKLRQAPRYPLKKFDIEKHIRLDPWFCGDARLFEFEYIYGKLPDPDSWIWPYYSEASSYCFGGQKAGNTKFRKKPTSRPSHRRHRVGSKK